MTDAAYKTEQAQEPTLWITDAEMIRRMGVPEKVAREAIRALDANPRGSGFPQKNKLWGDRRYWPAVKAYFDRDASVRLRGSSGRTEHGD